MFFAPPRDIQGEQRDQTSRGGGSVLFGIASTTQTAHPSNTSGGGLPGNWPSSNPAFAAPAASSAAHGPGPQLSTASGRGLFGNMAPSTIQNPTQARPNTSRACCPAANSDGGDFSGTTTPPTNSNPSSLFALPGTQSTQAQPPLFGGGPGGFRSRPSTTSQTSVVTSRGIFGDLNPSFQQSAQTASTSNPSGITLCWNKPNCLKPNSLLPHSGGGSSGTSNSSQSARSDIMKTESKLRIELMKEEHAARLLQDQGLFELISLLLQQESSTRYLLERELHGAKLAALAEVMKLTKSVHEEEREARIKAVEHDGRVTRECIREFYSLRVRNEVELQELRKEDWELEKDEYNDELDGKCEGGWATDL
ncbi:uncharacterized protein PAC_04633 [Phialocephala subalpina]|uniref:Uncharacterized protein n=1 Tax=Phialocephala subalpina TaxID=576137 RepID=A0A1L7WPQ1_9HELO|nr:uncharacterized protein PAC_04633 [Phialocephala subalpina]